MKKSIRNSLSVELGKKKFYNPNSYTVIDGAIAFIVALVAFFVLGKIVSPIISNIASSMDEATRNEYYFFFMFLSAVLSQLTIFLIAFAFSKIRKVGFFSGGGYVYKFVWTDILFGVMASFGIYLVFYSLHMQFVDDVGTLVYGSSPFSFAAAGAADEIAPPTTPYGVLFLLLDVFVVTTICPAICEEALFRGVVMRGEDKLGALPAVIISAAMFSLMHGSYQQMILQFIGGLCFGAAVIITKNFAVGAAMHFSYNLFISINTLFIAFNGTTQPESMFLIDAMDIIFGLIFIIVSFVYFGKKALVSYKNKILGKKTPICDKPLVACLTRRDIADSRHKEVDIQNVDLVKISHRKGYMFLSGKTFYPFNKKRSFGAETALITIGIVMAIIGIITAF